MPPLWQDVRVGGCRREALAPVLENPTGDAGRAAVAAELALTLKALHVNPKSYAAWHHRRWVVERGAADLQQELALVQRRESAEYLPFASSALLSSTGALLRRSSKWRLTLPHLMGHDVRRATAVMKAASSRV